MAPRGNQIIKSEKPMFSFPQEPARFEPNHLEPLLIYCHEINASDITIQTNQSIMIEVYGKLHKITRRVLSNTEVSELLNAIYGPNATTQIMSGKDVDTHYEIRPHRHQRYRHRVNGTGCYVDGHEGIQITLRTIPSEPPTLSSLNVPQEVLESMDPEEGVVYVTGATGSGKSTLLASIIKELAERVDGHRKILTYEAPIEFVYDTIDAPSSIISQSEIPRHLPSFSAGVRNALRRKPRLILVGESRDPETICSVMEAALTGHPVYTTLHSNGVAETIRRLVNSFPRDEQRMRSIDIIETMRLILWQKLVPSIDGKRIALREYLVFNEEIRDLLLDSDPDQITATTRTLLQKYGQPMINDVEAKYQQKLISARTYKILIAGLRQTEKPG